MRGDDRSCRYPPRGVWLGLILASMTVRALLAQDAPDDATKRRLKDPVSLAADRVTHWSGPDGQHWVHLWGNAAVLHGPDTVVRAREAIVRLSDESTEFDKIRRVEIYAEGQVRSAGDDGAPRASARAVVLTGETRLKCYQPKGLFEAKDPPWRLQIIARSGFRAQSAQPIVVSRRASDRDASAIDSRLDALTAQSTRVREQPAPKAKMRPIIATQAVVRNQSADLAEAPPLDGVSSKQAGDATTVKRSASPPKRDAMLRRAVAAGDGAPSAAPPVASNTTRMTDPQVQQAQAQQPPRAGTRPPIIDLPPIEGAPEVEVPNLNRGQDGRPPNIEPLPGADDAMTVPDLPDREPGRRRRAAAAHRANHAGKPAADAVFQSERGASEFQIAGHHARWRGDVHCPRRHQHRDPIATDGNDRYRG